MNYRGLLLNVAAACVLSAPATAFAHDTAPGAPSAKGLSYGESARLGSGQVRTYVVHAREKDAATGRRAPMEIGVEIPRNVLFGLPAESTATLLDFPIQARDTPFQYMMLDWNAQGHEPAGIYDLPHFDFHFYIQDIEDVETILPGSCAGVDCDAYRRAMTPVPPQFAPQGYINVGSVVPFMGNHLIDPSSPEFNGKRFTRTWLYGSYDGRVTFYEPMITVESLLETPNQCTEVKLPQQWPVSGYYPKKYCTAFDTERGVYKVYITEFVHRAAPSGAGN